MPNKRSIVIVVTTLILVGVCCGLYSTWLDTTRHRDDARASSSNNLKQIGLAFQSFNDTVGYLPHNGGSTDPEKLKAINYGWHNPEVRDSGTWATQILPFMESDSIFRNNRIEATSINEVPKWFSVVENQKHWQVTIRNYNCAGRSRSGYKSDTSSGCYPGIVTDYAINLFLNSPPSQFDDNGFARDGGVFIVDNSKLKIEEIKDGAGTTLLGGGKALSPSWLANNKASHWDESIFSPGQYEVMKDKIAITSTGTGRGHQPGEKPMIYRDLNLSGSNPPRHANTWGGPFEKGTLFLFCDGTVRSISYKASGTVNFARMLYPNDGGKVEFD